MPANGLAIKRAGLFAIHFLATKLIILSSYFIFTISARMVNALVLCPVVIYGSGNHP